jgi:hypothetical protein
MQEKNDKPFIIKDKTITEESGDALSQMRLYFF